MWLAADYNTGLIREWFKDRGWPELSRNTFKHYRQHYQIDIDAIRAERRLRALTTGLSIKAERVERLKQHADSLEAIKWEPDKNGRLWNEKAWRETLADIAAEIGDRKQVVEHGGDEARPIVFKFIDETTTTGSSNQIASDAHNATDGE